MADDWDSAVAKAKKILGDKAKIPKIAQAIIKGLAANQKAFQEFNTVREDLEGKVLALIDSNKAGQDAIEQFRDKIDEEDFGLDKKDKDDAKNIEAGKKVLLDYLDSMLAQAIEKAKSDRDLNKHLANIRNYKQGS